MCYETMTISYDYVIGTIMVDTNTGYCIDENDSHKKQLLKWW